MNFFSNNYPPVLLWAFVATIALFLIVDLGFLHIKPKKVSYRSALLQSTFWVAISLAYAGLIWHCESMGTYGISDGKYHKTLEYLSVYVTEKSLSVDNIFVILVIFKYFHIPERHYHGVLYWGILGAVVFRAVFIFTGSWLVEQWHWVLYFFGAFLIYSGFKIFVAQEEDEMDPEQNIVVKFMKKHMQFSTDTASGRFFTRQNGKLAMTLLFLTLISIETTDIMFALDSIPAAFAITRDDFLIFTSNIFAIMGLRAMFFLIAGIIDKFYLLQKGLSIVLIFIGGKMIAEIFDIHIPSYLSFIIIIITLISALVLSVIFKRNISDQKEGTHKA